MPEILARKLGSGRKLNNAAKRGRGSIYASKEPVRDAVRKAQRREGEAVQPEKGRNGARFKGLIEGKAVREVDL